MNRIDELLRSKLSGTAEKAGAADLHEMEQLLGAKKKKRRGAWWWWIIGLSISAIVGYALVHFSHSGTHSPNDTQVPSAKSTAGLQSPDSIEISTISKDTIHALENDTSSSASVITNSMETSKSTASDSQNDPKNLTSTGEAFKAKIKSGKKETNKSSILENNTTNQNNPASYFLEETRSTSPEQSAEKLSDTLQSGSGNSSDKRAAIVSPDSSNTSLDSLLTDQENTRLDSLSVMQPDSTNVGSTFLPASAPIASNRWEFQLGLSSLRFQFNTIGFATGPLETTNQRNGIAPDVSIRKVWGKWQTGIGLAHQRSSANLDDTELIVGDGRYVMVDEELILDYSYDEALEAAAKEFEGLTRYRRNALTLFGGYSITSPSEKWELLPKAGVTGGFIQSVRRTYVRKVVIVRDPVYPDFEIDRQLYVPRENSRTAVSLDAHLSAEVRRRLGTHFLIIAESGVNIPLTESNSTDGVSIQPWYVRIGIGYSIK